MGLYHSKAKSFFYAIEGIKEAFQKEPNLRVHFLIAFLVVISAFLLGFNRVEGILLIIMIFFVLALELLNTAIEAIVDLIAPEIKAQAKVAKDVSAAIVLLAALLSVVVGVLLFYPKIKVFF